MTVNLKLTDSAILVGVIVIYLIQTIRPVKTQNIKRRKNSAVSLYLDLNCANERNSWKWSRDARWAVVTYDHFDTF